MCFYALVLHKCAIIIIHINCRSVIYGVLSACMHTHNVRAHTESSKHALDTAVQLAINYCSNFSVLQNMRNWFQQAVTPAAGLYSLREFDFWLERSIPVGLKWCDAHAFIERKRCDGPLKVSGGHSPCKRAIIEKCAVVSLHLKRALQICSCRLIKTLPTDS